VRIPGRNDPGSNTFKLIENWLRQAKGDEKWLLVLDNADSDDVFQIAPKKANSQSENDLADSSRKPLIEYVPRTPHGAVIITSRVREIALGMVNDRSLIEVKPMERSEAIELVYRKLSLPQDETEHRPGCVQLVEELELLPLAIIQATNYIKYRWPRYSVSQYLDHFRKSDRESTKLLKNEAGQLYRDWEAKGSILVTWQISFAYILQRSPSAANLLSIMSFFDRSGIPSGLLQMKDIVETKHDSDSEPSGDSSDEEMHRLDGNGNHELEDEITTLINFSFIIVTENAEVFTMHRLVQLAVRIWLRKYGKFEYWKEKFTGILSAAYPKTGDYQNLETCRSLFPHVKSALSQRPESRQSILEWTALLYRCAWYTSDIGDHEDAKIMASKSRKYRVKEMGVDHDKSLESTTVLAKIHRLKGQLELAEKFDIQVMEARRGRLGENHPDTLYSMSCLASTYWYKGMWKEAEELLLKLISIYETLDDDCHEAQVALANLAVTYQKQGR